jgi:hypothetical protein
LHEEYFFGAFLAAFIVNQPRIALDPDPASQAAIRAYPFVAA